uniref:Putative site-specific DNA endonuclease n=1 Tax=Monomastix sp. M722 TaxID=141717 RepID=Q9B7G5_9CHLO|nr:putative site-specific DNA endonuclease [Monomastix sp. M722]
MKLTPDWICGFVEGEGTFAISLEKNENMKMKMQVRLIFKITQHIKNVQVLYAIKKYFGIGQVKPQNKNDIWEYRVSNFEQITNTVIPFFEKHSLHTSKKYDFLRVRYVSILIKRGDHLKEDGFLKIVKLRSRMNLYPNVEKGLSTENEKK